MLTWQGRVITTRRNFQVKMPARGPLLDRMKQGPLLRKRDMDTMQLHQPNNRAPQNPTIVFNSSGSISCCEDVKSVDVEPLNIFNFNFPDRLTLIFTESALRPIKSTSHNVRLSVFLSVCAIAKHPHPEVVETSG